MHHFTTPSPEELRDPVWLQRICRKISSGLKRPHSLDYEDVLSDAAVEVLKVARTYDEKRRQGVQTRFEPWLIITVRSDLRNKYSREWDWVNRRTQDIEETLWIDYIADRSDNPERSLLRDHLDTLAKTLSPALLETYLLVVQGYKTKDISTSLQIPTKASEARVYRMREVMREADVEPYDQEKMKCGG